VPYFLSTDLMSSAAVPSPPFPRPLPHRPPEQSVSLFSDSVSTFSLSPPFIVFMPGTPSLPRDVSELTKPKLVADRQPTSGFPAF